MTVTQSQQTPRGIAEERPPLVSVVMPVYNAAATARASIASILGQSLSQLECIVVDDGSTDDTPGLLRAAAAGDERVRLVNLPRNRGIVDALNRGIAEARSGLIARMDADDIAHPDRLRKQVEHLVRRPGTGLVGCKVAFTGDPAAQRGYALHVKWTNGLITHEDIALNRFIESPFAHPSVVFRRDLCERWGSYRHGGFPEDYELWLRWLAAGVVMEKLDETLLEWADLPGRLSRTDPRYSVRAFYRCKAGYLAQWLEAHNPRHPDVIVWGAGRETRKRAEMLVDRGVRITHYVDIDPRKIGQTIRGRPVLDESRLPEPDAAFVVSYVGSRGARKDIRRRLNARGYTEGVDFIMAA